MCPACIYIKAVLQHCASQAAPCHKLSCHGTRLCCIGVPYQHMQPSLDFQAFQGAEINRATEFIDMAPDEQIDSRLTFQGWS